MQTNLTLLTLLGLSALSSNNLVSGVTVQSKLQRKEETLAQSSFLGIGDIPGLDDIEDLFTETKSGSAAFCPISASDLFINNYVGKKIVLLHKNKL